MTVNKVILLGRLGKDPESRQSESGFQFCNFSLATDEPVKSKSGEYENKTEWHNVVTLGKTAENCAKYLKKGSQVYIEGKIQNRKWEKDGVTRYTTEILADNVRFIGSKKEAEQGGTVPNNGTGISDAAPVSDFDDDNIPF